MENRAGRTASRLGCALLLLVLLPVLVVVAAFEWWWNVALPNGADRARKADIENNLRLIEAAPAKLRRAAADGVITVGEVVTSLDPHWTATRTARQVRIVAYYRVDFRDPGLDRCVRYTVSIPLNASSTVGWRYLRADSPECEKLSHHVPRVDHDAPIV